MAWNKTFDTETPAGSEDPKLTDDYFRDTKTALQERENVDHYWPLDGNNVVDADEVGYHRKCTFPNEELDGVTAPTEGVSDAVLVYGKDAADDETNDWAELHVMDEQDNEIQITKDGYLNTEALSPVTQADSDATSETSYSYSVSTTWTQLQTVSMTLKDGDKVLVMFHATAHNTGSSGKLKFRIQADDSDLAVGIMRINDYATDTICLQALYTADGDGEVVFDADYYKDGGTWNMDDDYTIELTVVEFKK